MMYTNSQIDTYNNSIAVNPDTAPDRSVTLTGTISSVKIWVTGVGTRFLTEIGGGSVLGQPTIISKDRGYICDLNSAEIRRITGIIDNTHLTIDHPFTTPLANSPVNYVSPSRWIKYAYYVQNAVLAIAINGVTLVTSEAGDVGMKSDTVFSPEPCVVQSLASPLTVTRFAQK